MEAHLPGPIRFRMTPLLWGSLALALALVVVAFWQPILVLLDNWVNREEYSHGLILPLLAAYLIYQRRDLLAAIPFHGSWLGLLVCFAGVLIWFAGEFSTIYAVTQFALIVVIAGVALSLVGAAAFRHLIVPIFLLLLTIPLPRFAYENFSSQLQLISSELGVWLLRLAGVSVYLEGNVIDLGHFQMQVVEACDGVRYLFPMMALGVVIAYFFRGPLWQRIALFVATIPITIGMNSLRIAMIGLFAEHGSTALAEGIMHDVQGWAMFMLSLAVVLALAFVFVRAGRSKRAFADAFDFGAEPGSALPADVQQVGRRLPVPFVLSVVALLFVSAAAFALPEREEVRPAREYCVTFPMQVGNFQGRLEPMDAIYLDALNVDDHLHANYRAASGMPVNLWIAYYGSQSKGQATHSPRTCLPGSGWKIESFGQHALGGATSDRTVNRALIAFGDNRQLVYYWFKQRERWVTSEIAVKWYILVDSLLRNRSDGALVRVVTTVGANESVADADRRLETFATQVQEELSRYVPD